VAHDAYEFDDRRPVTRVVANAAAAVALLCLAFLAGHASSSHSTNAAATHPAPTPTRTETVTIGGNRPAPAVPASGLHPNNEHVLVGYAHTRGGAVAAAGNYTAALYVQPNRTKARELSVLRTICATPADATRLAGDFSSEDQALAKILDVADLQSAGVIAYGHPVGYRVESYRPDTAAVDVYVVGGQGVAGTPTDSVVSGETFYEVDEVQLTWRGDWRLSNWAHLAQNNGPELASVAAESYLPFPLGQPDAP